MRSDIRISKKILYVFVSAAVFFGVTYAFHTFLPVFTVSEVRPSAAFNPIFGILCGPAGALGCALGNLLSDLLIGYDLSVALIGFPIQFLFGLISYLVFYGVNKDEENPLMIDRISKLNRIALSIAAGVLFVTVSLGIVMQCFGYSDFFSLSTLFIFMNDFDFGMILGCPTFILVNRIRTGEKKIGSYRYSLNELLIIICVINQVIIAGTIAILGYIWLGDMADDPFALWSRIFYAVTIAVNVHFLVSYGVLRSTEMLWGNRRTDESAEVTYSREKSVLTVKVKGRLDDSGAEKISLSLMNMMKKRKIGDVIVIDASEMTYISSGGMRTLLSLREKLEGRCSLTIENPNDMMKTVLRMSGFIPRE